MAEELYIIEAPEVIEQAPPTNPGLPPDRKKALGQMIIKMQNDKLPEATIKGAVGRYMQLYGGNAQPVAPPKPKFNLAFTDLGKPQVQKQPYIDPANAVTPEQVRRQTEQRAATGKLPEAQLADFYNRPTEDESKHREEIDKAHSTLINQWNTIDTEAREQLMNNLTAQQVQKNSGIDATGTKPLLPAILQKQEERRQKESIPQEAVDQFKQGEENQRLLLAKKAQALKAGGLEKEANDLQASVYALESESRADRNNIPKINKNIEDIKSGKVMFDPVKGILIKPLDFAEGVAEGLKTRNRSYEGGYKLAEMNKEDGIKYLNEEIKEVDPDKPIGVPGTVANMIGSEGIMLGKAIGSGIATGFFSKNPYAAGAAATAVTTDEAAMRSYHDEFVRTYAQIKNELRQDNPNATEAEIDSEAYEVANKNAKIAATIDAGGNAIMNMTGAKLGKEATSFQLGKNVIDTLKKTGKGVTKFLKEGFPEGAKNAAAVAGLQAEKNILAQKQGIERATDEGVAESFGHLLAFHYAVGAVHQTVGAAKDIILQGLSKKSPQLVNEAVTNLVEDGNLTPEQAEQTILEVDQHRAKDSQIPETVTDDNMRLKIQKKLDEHADIDLKLKGGENGEGKIADALSAPLKERKKQIEEDVEILSKDPKEQVRLLGIKTKELEIELSEDADARRDGGKPKLEDREPIKRRLKELNEMLKEVDEKINSNEYKATTIIEEYADKLPGIEKEMAAQDPEGYLQYIAEQAHGIDKEGNLLEGGGREQGMIEMGYPKKLIDAAKEMFPIKEQSSISVIRPEDNKAPEIIENVKIDEPNTNTAIEPIAENEGAAQQPRVEEPIPENTTPNDKAGSKSASSIHVERPETVLSHRGLQDVANEFGLDDVKVRTEKSDIQLRQDADNVIYEWVQKGEYNGKVEKLLSEVEEGKVPTDKERVILERHLATLKDDLRNTPNDSPDFDTKLQGIKRLKEAGERARSEAGAALRLPTGGSDPIVDINDAYIEKMEANGVDVLTPEQKIEVEKQFTELQDAKLKFEAEVKRLKEELAAKEFEKQKPKTKTKRTAEDFKAERAEILAAARADLLKVAKGGGGAMASVPGAAQLAALAPYVYKLTKNLAEQGIGKLSDAIDALHIELKDVVDGITKQQIHDILAGEYDGTKTATVNQAQERLRNIKTEAKLLNELDALQKGSVPSTPKDKVKRNQRIAALQKQVRNLKGDAGVLEARKSRIANEIKQIEADLAAGNYQPAVKKPPLVLDKAAQAAQDKLIKLKIAKEVGLIREKNATMTGWKKIGKGAIELLNIPRTLMSSVDLSAPGRQALVASASHPILAGKAFVEMLRAAKSEKVFNRYFDNLKSSPEYKIMKDSKLGLTDPLDPRLSAKEEAFMSNLPQKIPGLGRLVKGSERAYVLYLNKMRADIFKQGIDAFMSDGKTPQNSPKLYEALAAHINNITGRGNVYGKLENTIPVLNALFFSPRLMASRLNLLTNFANPLFYKNVPKEVKAMYFKDMAKFIGFGASLLGLAALSGADVETDPRSSDFLKIKFGDTRFDVLGGFQQYVRTLAQGISGQKKNLRTGDIKELDGKGAFGEDRGTVALRFLRGKLAPVPATAYDYISGRTIMGDKVLRDQFWGAGEKEKDIADVIFGFAPLIKNDLVNAIEDPSLKKLLGIGASTFGFGVQDFETGKQGTGGGSGATGSYRNERSGRNERSN